MKTKNMLLTLGLLGALGLTTGCAKFNSASVSEDKTTKTIRLATSGFYESSIFAQGIRYDGMPSDSVFSISKISYDAVNTFCRVSSKKINFNEQEYNLIKVTPDSLVISCNR